MPDPPSDPVPPSGFASLVEELRRRRVFRVAGIYLVAGAGFIEGAGAVLQNLGAPPFVARWLTLLVVAGFPVAVAASWAYDVRLHRERTGGEHRWWGTPQARLVFAMGVVAGMALLAVFARGAVSWSASAGAPTAAEVPAPAPSVPVIAVLATEALDSSEESVLARAIQGSLTDALSQYQGLEVRSQDVVDSYARRLLPLDSLALRLGLHYLVSTALRASDTGTELTVRVLDARGTVVASPRTFTVGPQSVEATERLMELASDYVLRTVGSELRAAEWRFGTESNDALRLVFAADLMFEQARRLIGDTAGTREYDGRERGARAAALKNLLMDADALLHRAMATDPAWDTPVLRHATLAMSLAYVLEDPMEVERVLDRAMGALDSLLGRHGQHPRALALRGRLLFWKTLYGAGDAVRDSLMLRHAEASLKQALQQDAGMAAAATWLSDVLYEEADFHQARIWAERALQLDAYQMDASRIMHRLAMATFEMGSDTTALRMCREALDRFADIPANHGCVLEVLAFGDAPADVPAAWDHLARLRRMPAAGEPATLAYYETTVAAILARAGLADSAEHVLQRARERYPDGFGRYGNMSWLEAAVRFRLGQTDTAASLLRDFIALGDPATELILARRAVRPYLATLVTDRPTP